MRPSAKPKLEPITTMSASSAERAVPYLARVLQYHLLSDPESPFWTAEGTVVFVDISGFTKMSERLARKGREGAEEISETIGAGFATMLAVAYGTAAACSSSAATRCCCWFHGEDHAANAPRRGGGMRRTLRDVGAIESSAGK